MEREDRDCGFMALAWRGQIEAAGGGLLAHLNCRPWHQIPSFRPRVRPLLLVLGEPCSRTLPGVDVVLLTLRSALCTNPSTMTNLPSAPHEHLALRHPRVGLLHLRSLG